MTCILTYASSRYVLQVSDRLVTQDYGNGRIISFDTRANKNVIYMARNAVVSIGYSGSAYFEGIPTDQWMAQKLLGETFPIDTDGKAIIPFRLGAGPRAQKLDIGQALELLRTELDAAITRMTPTERPEFHQIIVAGWQWKRNSQRPILSLLDFSKEKGKFEITQKSRYWHCRREQGRGHIYAVSIVPSTLKNSTTLDLGRVGQSLANQAPDQAERILTDAICEGYDPSKA